jgi:hypothetical protein
MQRTMIFVSSTSDLREERAAVSTALRPEFDPYLYETDHAGEYSPEKHCRAMILKSHVFMGLLGSEYGSLFSSKPGERSIVEWEFDVARERKDLQIMMFLRRESQKQVVDPRQQKFRNRVSNFSTGVWCKEFDSPTELVQLARESLVDWLSKFQAACRNQQRALRRWLMRFALVISVGAGVGVPLLLIPLLRGFVTRNSIVSICIVAGFVVIACGVLLWTEIGGRNE